ncbi:nucleotidyltransferase domain-containing protein [Agrobacterium vaccinii]|nr:nucleotidyltransferase domain-containing protein [Agrobacterium vaccinii]
MFSKRQQKILRALLLHPRREFGTNELIAIGGPGVGAGRNVIRALIKAGVVVAAKRRNQLVYSVNTNSPIYEELRSIMRKTFGIANVVADELGPIRERISEAFVFGSVARGTERADSDVDLMIIGDVDLFELAPAVAKMEAIFERSVDLNLYWPDEWQSLSSDRVVRALLKTERIQIISKPILAN